MTRALDQVMAVMETAFDPHWREAWTRQQVANSLALPHTYAILVDAEARLGDFEHVWAATQRRACDVKCGGVR